MRAIRPLFPYYGAKWRLSARYPSPRHRLIIEPFAGSACYALHHYHRDVLLIDRDPIIVAIWRYLLTANPGEVLALPDLALGQTTDDLDVPDGARYLIGFWLNRGTQRPNKTPGAWMRNGVRPGSFWGTKVRSRIADALRLIRHWQVVEGDYTEAPNVEATWFVDPPYQDAGRHYRYNSVDYSALGAWCWSRQGQVIACEAAGANWLPFSDFGGNGTGIRKKYTREAIWLNNQSVTQMDLFKKY